MPKGTAVDNAYQALKGKGYSSMSAAKMAQSQTGEALLTGKPPKRLIKGKNKSGNAMAYHHQPGSNRMDPGEQSYP